MRWRRRRHQPRAHPVQLRTRNRPGLRRCGGRHACWAPPALAPCPRLLKRALRSWPLERAGSPTADQTQPRGAAVENRLLQLRDVFFHFPMLFDKQVAPECRHCARSVAVHHCLACGRKDVPEASPERRRRRRCRGRTPRRWRRWQRCFRRRGRRRRSRCAISFPMRLITLNRPLWRLFIIWPASSAPPIWGSSGFDPALDPKASISSVIIIQGVLTDGGGQATIEACGRTLHPGARCVHRARRVRGAETRGSAAHRRWESPYGQPPTLSSEPMTMHGGCLRGHMRAYIGM